MATGAGFTVACSSPGLLTLSKRRLHFVEEGADARGILAEIMHAITRNRPDIDLGSRVVAADADGDVVGKAHDESAVGRLDQSRAGQTRWCHADRLPAEPLHRFLDHVEHFGGRTLELHRADVRIASFLLSGDHLVGILDAIGVGRPLRRQLLEFERIARRGLDVGQRREKDGLREIVERDRKPDQGDGEGADGEASAKLTTKPDADETEHCDAGGGEQSDNGHGEQIHRRWRAQGGKTVQQHRQHEELQEK